MVNAAKERFIYSPEAMIKGFARVSSDIVKTPSTELVVKWYRASYVDLQIWIDKNQDKVIRQQFSFLGLIVEWNHIQGIKTGYVLDKPEGSSESKGLEVIYDKVFEPKSVAQAIEVLSLANTLPEKGEIIKNYENSPIISRWQSFLLIAKHLFAKQKTKNPSK